MTDQDLTAPEHVERLCEIEENGGCADLQFTEYGPTLRALSAALEAERERAEAADAARDQAILALASEAQKRGEAEGRLAASEMPGMVDSWRRRAEAAEAERDLLDGNRKSLEANIAALSAALENERAKTKRLRGLLSDVIGRWDWWNKDQYDRCQSVPGDAIEAARAELRDGWPF